MLGTGLRGIRTGPCKRALATGTLRAGSPGQRPCGGRASPRRTHRCVFREDRRAQTIDVLESSEDRLRTLACVVTIGITRSEPGVVHLARLLARGT
jgi:hypothetical protein